MRLVTWIAHHKVLSLACVILLTELAFRRFAPRSAALRALDGLLPGPGVVLDGGDPALVYLFSVGPVGLGMRLLGKDPLDRTLEPEPTFWRRHEPNPLGPEAAVRHQF